MLTKNQRTHYILLTDWEKINITEAQKKLYQEEVDLKKHNERITIYDIDTNEELFNGRCSKIERFCKREIDPSIQSRRYICNFGTRHPLNEDCDCKFTYQTLGILFQDELEKLWYKIDYPSDISPAMQQHYLDNLKNSHV